MMADRYGNNFVGWVVIFLATQQHFTVSLGCYRAATQPTLLNIHPETNKATSTGHNLMFTIHIFDEPTADTFDSASRYIYSEKPNGNVQNKKFLRFAELVGKIYPNYEDEDGYNDNNIWPEGLPNGVTNDVVLTVGLKSILIDGQLMSNIAHAAVDAGLQMFDPQSGMLWRSDRRVIDPSNKSEAFLPQNKPKKGKSQPKCKLSTEGVEKYLYQKFSETFTAQGWQIVEQQSMSVSAYAWRQQGDIKQGLRFYVRSDAKECSLGVTLCFQADQIANVLQQFMLELDIHSDKMRYQHLGNFDIFVPVEQLYGFVQTREALNMTFDSEPVQTWQQLEHWNACFLQWFETVASPSLAMVKDISALGRLLDDESHRNYSRGQLTAPKEWLARLAVIHLSKSPVIADWLTLVRARIESESSYLKNTLDMCNNKETLQSWQHLQKLVDLVESRA